LPEMIRRQTGVDEDPTLPRNQQGGGRMPWTTISKFIPQGMIGERTDGNDPNVDWHNESGSCPAR
jgi:hypothetical protein